MDGMTSVIHPEVGQPGNMEASWRRTRDGMVSAFTPKPDEHTWELTWPLCNAVYQEMRRSDGQVASLLKAIRLPIEGAHWSLEGDDVRPEVMEFVKEELGITDPDKPRRRKRRTGIVWQDHVREALLMLPFGHVFFEQVYSVRPSDPNRIHLRKLGLRLPTTITDIDVARDGGLKGIWQASLDPTDPDGVFIPVDRLVGYVLDREGGDWYGNSILRTAYKHWLIKDHLMRIDAQSVERNGMGLPVLTYDPSIPNAREDAERIVSEVRAGESAGIALPVGEGLGDFKLVGVSGAVVDAVPRMTYHDQQTSRSALAMFLDLGHDDGARSLGESQTDFFLSSLQAVADQVAEVATEHVIRDLVEVNWGADEPYPVMSPGHLSDNGAVALDTLATLADKGLIVPDAKLEAHIRARTGLPEADPTTTRTTTVTGGTSAPSAAQTAPSLPEPNGVGVPEASAAGDSALARVESIMARLSELQGGGGHP